MIISHKYRFIFIKTRKTAGTSVELMLEEICAADDIVTPILPAESGHSPRNYAGVFNPFYELVDGSYGGSYANSAKRTIGDLYRKRKFYNHMCARLVRSRIGKTLWDSYFKWCVERDPVDKVVSDYFMKKHRFGGSLSPTEYIETQQMPINSRIYCDRNGGVMVDRVIPYENLSEGLSEVIKNLSLPTSVAAMPRAKSSYRPGSKYQNPFSQRQLRTIREAFREDTEILKSVS